MGRCGCGARIRLDDQPLRKGKGKGLIAGDVRVAGTDVLGSLAAALPEKLSQQGLAFNFAQASRHRHPVVQPGIQPEYPSVSRRRLG